MSLLLPGLVALSAGCTFEPGVGFATLEGASLHAWFDPGSGRDLGDGAFLTDGAWQVDPDLLALEVEGAALVSYAGTSGETFDPTDPPEGYSGCHSGHCHAEDGSLVSYEEIEAELAGGEATGTTVATVVAGESLDLLQGSEGAWTDVEPSPELPRGDISRVSLLLSGLSLQARVQESTSDTGTSDTGSAALYLEVDLALEATLEASVDLEVDRQGQPTVSLDLSLPVDGTLLDDLDLEDLSSEGIVVVDDAGSEAGATIVENLSQNTLEVDLSPDEAHGEAR